MPFIHLASLHKQQTVTFEEKTSGIVLKYILVLFFSIHIVRIIIKIDNNILCYNKAIG